MKKSCIAIVCSLTIVFSVFQIGFNLYKYINRQHQINQELIKIASAIETSNNQNRSYSFWSKKLLNQQNYEEAKNNEMLSNNVFENEENQILFQDNIIGILEIPKLKVKAPIKDGTTQDIISEYIGHFKESNYWNGNVSLASHNSGTNAHYFEKINLLKQNDEIYYKTQKGTKIYKVQSINKIKSTDWSMINSIENANQNTINLVTCINGLPNYRICVRAIEI